jgi:hypothetical protein
MGSGLFLPSTPTRQQQRQYAPPFLNHVVGATRPAIMRQSG